jgi:hypothetical protein
MAKGYKARGGGINPLSFKVVGGTSAPSNPKENTIWVNTSTAITDWVFEATQPTAATGRVWIQVGIDSSAAFNALKKNWLYVYPISVKQYVNGAWADKTAKSYIGGKWVDWWNGELYKNGNEYITFTGGWESRKSTEAAGTLKKNASDFVVSTSGYQLIYCKTVNTVDLTKYSKVTFKITDISASVHNEITLGVYPANFAFNWADTTAQLKLTHETGTHSIDVSALSGKYYVAVRAASNSGVSTTVTVSEVFME